MATTMSRERFALAIGPWLVILLCFLLGSQQASCDDRYVLVTGFASGNVVRFDLSTGTPEEVVVLEPSSGPDTGDRPRGLAIDEEGRIYVALRGGTQNVKRFTWNGIFVDDFTESIGGYGPGQIGFSDAGDLLVGGDVSDNHSVFRYDGDTGDLIDSFRLDGFTNVVGLLVDRNFVYSAAFFSGNVAKYDISHKPVTGVPFVDGDGLVDRGIGMTIGHSGNLLVASIENRVVQEFDIETGEFIGTFLDFGEPVCDVQYDPYSRLYYVTVGDDSVLEFDEFANPTSVLQSDAIDGPIP